MHHHLELFFNHKPNLDEINKSMEPFKEGYGEEFRHLSCTREEAIESQRVAIEERMEWGNYSKWQEDKESYEAKNADNPDHIQHLKDMEANHDNDEWLYKEATRWVDEEEKDLIDENGGIWSLSNPLGIWDWFQIGGRWKGDHKADYKADEDPDHKEVCRFCGGTGKRTDMELENGCNACHGSGMDTKWPTKWEPHEIDICPATAARGDLTSAYLIVDGEVHIKEKWNGFSFVDGGYDGNVHGTLLKLGKDLEEGWLVTVDIHS